MEYGECGKRSIGQTGPQKGEILWPYRRTVTREGVHGLVIVGRSCQGVMPRARVSRPPFSSDKLLQAKLRTKFAGTCANDRAGLRALLARHLPAKSWLKRPIPREQSLMVLANGTRGNYLQRSQKWIYFVTESSLEGKNKRADSVHQLDLEGGKSAPILIVALYRGTRLFRHACLWATASSAPLRPFPLCPSRNHRAIQTSSSTHSSSS